MAVIHSIAMMNCRIIFARSKWTPYTDTAHAHTTTLPFNRWPLCDRLCSFAPSMFRPRSLVAHLSGRTHSLHSHLNVNKPTTHTKKKSPIRLTLAIPHLPIFNFFFARLLFFFHCAFTAMFTFFNQFSFALNFCAAKWSMQVYGKRFNNSNYFRLNAYCGRCDLYQLHRCVCCTVRSVYVTQ